MSDETCPKCGHREHDKQWCFNAASDSDCTCDLRRVPDPAVSPDRIAEITARAEAATADAYDIQPSTHDDDFTIYSRFIDDDQDDDEGGQPIGMLAHEVDAVLIAHAREDIPFLLAEVSRLTAQIADIERLCDETDTETNEAIQGWLVDNIRAALALPATETKENEL